MTTPKDPKYSDVFNLWWAAYPRKTAKFKAFQSWNKHVDPNVANVVIADTEKRNRMRFWATDKSKIPMPTTFLNQRRWEDEWEDEVKTRGKETVATYRPMPEAKVDDTPLMSAWAMMCNRLMRNYLLKCGGFTDAMLSALMREKNKTLAEIEPVIGEEMELADDKKAAKIEMAFVLADTLLSRFDSITGRTMKPAVIDMSKRPR